MTHRFDRSETDPYVESAQQVEARMFSDTYERGASESIYDVLSNAIVTGLGDIAAAAYREGVNSPEQMKGLARAVAHVADAVFASYRGEVTPDETLDAIKSHPRVARLTDVDRDSIAREVEETRQLEHLVLSARRVPDLVDYITSLGVPIDDSVMDQGTLVVGTHPTPNPEQQ